MKTTLLEALKKLYPDSSNTKLRKFLESGRIAVGGTVVRNPNFEVDEGQEIRLQGHRAKYEGELKILYEDPELIVIDKPAGLLSVSSNFETEETAHMVIKQRHPGKKVYVVHRLDQETSGVMVFAFNEKSFNALKAELAKRKMGRKYIAIVEGKLEGKGTWDCYLREDAAYRVHVTDNPEIGERAVTHYESLRCTKAYSLIRCTLETGKKHQIRVHAMTAHHPLLGDKRYGAKSNKIERLALHAEQLEFTHPKTLKKLHFSTPMPVEFERLFQK